MSPAPTKIAKLFMDGRKKPLRNRHQELGFFDIGLNGLPRDSRAFGTLSARLLLHPRSLRRQEYSSIRHVDRSFGWITTATTSSHQGTKVKFIRRQLDPTAAKVTKRAKTRAQSNSRRSMRWETRRLSTPRFVLFSQSDGDFGSGCGSTCSAEAMRG